MRTRIVLFLATLAMVVAAGPAHAQSDAGPRVDAIFAQWNHPNTAGCAVGVDTDTGLVYARGYGSANLDYDVPLGPDSKFYLASVSKQFTAAAVVLAARQGRLSLDDDIRKWLPEIPDYGTPITIRQLIHHESGLRDFFTLFALAGRRYQDGITDQELLGLISRQRALNFAPGSEFLYSNTGYAMLAQIVKRATGKTLRQFADEQIFRPLGMTNTHYHDQADEVMPNRVLGYEHDSSGYHVDDLFEFAQVGDGGLYSTVQDLARWDRNFYHSRIGGPGFIDQLLEAGVLTNGDTLPYAFGLTKGTYRGLRIVEHGGSLSGFRTEILRFPDARLSAIVLCNDGRMNPALLARRVAEVYLAPRMTAAVAQTSRGGVEAGNGATPAGRPAPDAPSVDVRQYAGRYDSDELETTYELVVTDGALVIRRGRAADVKLKPTTRDAFTTANGSGLTLRFTRDASSRLTGFVVDAGRVRGIRFERR